MIENKFDLSNSVHLIELKEILFKNPKFYNNLILNELLKIIKIMKMRLLLNLFHSRYLCFLIHFIDFKFFINVEYHYGF